MYTPPSFWQKNSLTLGNWVYTGLNLSFSYIYFVRNSLTLGKFNCLLRACGLQFVWRVSVYHTKSLIQPVMHWDTLRYTGRCTETCKTKAAWVIHQDTLRPVKQTKLRCTETCKNTQLASAALSHTSFYPKNLFPARKDSSVWGLQVLVYEASKYWCVRP